MIVYLVQSVSVQQMFEEKRLRIDCEIGLRCPLNTSGTHDQCSTLFRACRDKVLLGSVLIDLDMLPGIFKGGKKKLICKVDVEFVGNSALSFQPHPLLCFSEFAAIYQKRAETIFHSKHLYSYTFNAARFPV